MSQEKKVYIYIALSLPATCLPAFAGDPGLDRVRELHLSLGSRHEPCTKHARMPCAT